MRSPLQLTQPRGDASPRVSLPRVWGRRLAHAVAILIGWALFYWGWRRVLAGNPDFAELRLLMLGAAIAVPVITISWILHNRGIHRRKGARRSVPAATLDYRVDFNGREVVADFGALAFAQRIDIVVEGPVKRYGESHRGDTTAGYDALGTAIESGAASGHRTPTPATPPGATQALADNMASALTADADHTRSGRGTTASP